MCPQSEFQTSSRATRPGMNHYLVRRNFGTKGSRGCCGRGFLHVKQALQGLPCRSKAGAEGHRGSGHQAPLTGCYSPVFDFSEEQRGEELTSERFVGRRAKQSRPVLQWGGGGWLHPPGTHPPSLTAHHRFSALPPLSGLQRYLQHPEVQKAVGCPWKGSELAESGGCQVVSACPCVAESSGLWTLLSCNALTWLHSLLLVPQVLGQSWLFVPQPQQPQHCSVHAQHRVHP